MALNALVLEHEPEVDDNRGRRNGRRLGWIALVAVLALFATALGFITSNEVQTNTRFDQTQRSLDSTQVSISAVLTNLGTVRQELQGVNVQVYLTAKALAQDAADLEAARTELTNAQSDVSHQTTMITNLQACLGGVQEALNALSVSDQAGAIDALNVVAPSCTGAVASDG
jgi:hypothetical protein